MRIRSIRIERWRHFENIGLDVGDEAPLVCLVGANGTGKSHILELIASCAHRLGLAHGVEIPRGDPFQDDHAFAITYILAPGVTDAVDSGLASEPLFGQWDRTITIRSQKQQPQGHQLEIEAGGLENPQIE